MKYISFGRSAQACRQVLPAGLVSLVLAGLIGAAATPHAAAGTITYTYAGTGDGSFNGTPFTDAPFTISFLGNTSARIGTAPNYSIEVTGTVLVFGFAAAAISTTEVLYLGQTAVSPTRGQFYPQSSPATPGEVFLSITADYTHWDEISSLGPEPFFLFGPGSSATFNTGAGPVIIDSISGAGAMTASATPEPTSFSLFGCALLASVSFRVGRRFR